MHLNVFRTLIAALQGEIDEETVARLGIQIINQYESKIQGYS